MSTLLEKLERDALSLEQAERAFLADRLLSSLGNDALSDIDASWVEEAERRYREYKNGARAAIPASKIFAEADGLLK